MLPERVGSTRRDVTSHLFSRRCISCLPRNALQIQNTPFFPLMCVSSVGPARTSSLHEPVTPPRFGLSSSSDILDLLELPVLSRCKERPCLQCALNYGMNFSTHLAKKNLFPYLNQFWRYISEQKKIYSPSSNLASYNWDDTKSVETWAAQNPASILYYAIDWMLHWLRRVSPYDVIISLNDYIVLWSFGYMITWFVIAWLITLGWQRPPLA